MGCARTLLFIGFLLFSNLDKGFGQFSPATSGSPARSSSSIDPADRKDPGFSFKARAEEVFLHATVIDGERRLVTDLEKNNFTVLEDGNPQVVTSFRHEDSPVAIGIVIDNSGSMLEKRDRVNKAALNLILASNRQDQVFIVNFNEKWYVDQDFTGDIAKLREALEKVQSTGGTALYDSLIAAADHLKGSVLQKKILVVVTDGEDNDSSQTLQQTIDLLQTENGPTVYAIGILGDDNPKRARRALEKIAEATGGIAFTPKTVDRVDQMSRTIARDIRVQYTITYRPSNRTLDGEYRRIRVEAKDREHKKLTVRTRTGYYAVLQRASR